MKKIISTILSFAMVASLAVLPTTVSAESTTIFKYENDFSTIDAPGAESTGAWDMEGLGKWTTVKTKETDDVDQWSVDTTVLGPSGEADGVLRLGDGARPAFFFDTPVTAGNVHVGFDILFDTSAEGTRSNYPYSYYGFMNKWNGEYNQEDDTVLVSATDGTTAFDNPLVKAYMFFANAACGSPQYGLGGLGDGNIAYKTLTPNEWMRVDVIFESIDNKDNMAVKYYVNGKLIHTMSDSALKKVLQPFYGFVLQTSGNFNNEYALIDNLVIEQAYETKTLELVCESDYFDYGTKSISFDLTDDVDPKHLTSENIIVTKDYGARTLKEGEYWVENATSNSFDLVFDGKMEKGIYTVKLEDKIVSSWGMPAEEAVKFTVGKFENFVYRQDFSEDDGPSGTGAWDDSSIGQWVTAVTSATNDVDQWERKDTLGADGKPGVLSLGDNARPAFWFNMPVADGSIHLSYYAKFKEQKKTYPYYYSGFAGAGYTGDITISNDKVNVSSHSDAKLVDTFMAWDMHTSAPYIEAGILGSNQPNSNDKISCDVTKWYRFDVLININPDGNIEAHYYVDGVKKLSRTSSSAQAPFYGMIFQTSSNFDDGEVLIDDVLIRHYSYDKEGVMEVIRTDAEGSFIDTEQESVTFLLSEAVNKSSLSNGITVMNKTTKSNVPFSIETIDEAAPTPELSRGFKIIFENEEAFSKGTKLEVSLSDSIRGYFTGSVADKILLRTEWEKEGDVLVPAVDSIVFSDASGKDVLGAPYSSALTKAIVTFNTTVTEESVNDCIRLEGGADYEISKIESITVDGDTVSRVTVEFPKLLDGDTEYSFIVDAGIENVELNGSEPVFSKFAETLSFKTQNDAGTVISENVSTSGSKLEYNASIIKNDNSEQSFTIIVCGYKNVTVNNEEGNPESYSQLTSAEHYPITLSKNERGVFSVKINVSDWDKSATSVKTYIVRWPDLSTVETDDNGFIK